MNLLNRILSSICTATILFIGLSVSANAFPVLRVIHSDLPGGSIDIVDADEDGLVQFSGSLGGFTLAMNVGVSYPALGTLDRPKMDLFSMEVTSAAQFGGFADSITIMLTDSGFLGDSASSVQHPFITAIGGTTDGLVEAQAYLDNSNALFGMGSSVASYNSNDLALGFGAFGGSGATKIATDDLYSLTLVTTITHTGANQVSSMDFLVALVEPSTVALFAIGLAGLGFVRRQRKLS